MQGGVAPSQLVLSSTERALPGADEGLIMVPDPSSSSKVTSLLPPIEVIEEQSRIHQQEPRTPEVRLRHMEISPGMDIDSEAIFNSYIDANNLAQNSPTNSLPSLSTPSRARTTHRSVADAINHVWASPSPDTRATFPSPSYNHPRQITPFSSPKGPDLMNVDEQPRVQTQQEVNSTYVVHL
jgi:hypothetical protein